MNFSIILASRERVHLLDSLLASIAQTTADKANVEGLVCIDKDDRVTRRFLDRFQQNYSSCAHFILRERSRNLNEAYLTWAFRSFAKGDFAIICNDDCVFKTPNVDQIILGKLNQYLSDKPDGVVYGWIADALTERALGLNYCCFPLISRKAAEAVGFVMPSYFHSWGADIAVWRIYNAINRVCDLGEMLIEHISYHSNKRSRDHISSWVEQLQRDSPAHPLNDYDISTHVNKLTQVIGGVRNFNKPQTITNATIRGATIVGATIVGGVVTGGEVGAGRIVGGTVSGGVLQGGELREGVVDGHVQD